MSAFADAHREQALEGLTECLTDKWPEFPLLRVLGPEHARSGQDRLQRNIAGQVKLILQCAHLAEKFRRAPPINEDGCRLRRMLDSQRDLHLSARDPFEHLLSHSWLQPSQIARGN